MLTSSHACSPGLFIAASLASLVALSVLIVVRKQHPLNMQVLTVFVRALISYGSLALMLPRRRCWRRTPWAQLVCMREISHTYVQLHAIVAVTFSDSVVVLQAFVITAVIVIGLTLFTFQTSVDFTIFHSTCVHTSCHTSIASFDVPSLYIRIYVHSFIIQSFLTLAA